MRDSLGPDAAPQSARAASLREAFANPLRKVPEYDPIVERYIGHTVSFTEAEALDEYWRMGEDGWLREDYRFRQTPGGRWMLSEGFLANDRLYEQLMQGEVESLDLTESLEALEREVKRRPCVFCEADERLVLEAGRVRLAARELSDRPRIEAEVPDEDKYTTHLPVHTLKATAASLPSGEWGPGAQEQRIETLGWVRVRLDGRTANHRMFVARVEGHSMDDGRSGLEDRSWAVFELWPDTAREQVVLVRGAFVDPETGAYAVKKYVGVARDASGRYERVRLVSLNPDRARYPDIVLEQQDEADVTVVARLVRALRGRDYARQPKRRPTPGRRDITRADVLERRIDGLRTRMAQFFSGPGPVESGEGERPPGSGPSARLRARLGIHDRPDKLRVICTSASLGSDEQALARMSAFVADLTGKSPGDFVAVTGQREIPAACLHRALANHSVIGKLLELTAGKALSMDALARVLFPSSSRPTRALESLLTLGVLARPRPDEPGLVPTRVHMMFRGLPGLYACIDRRCPGRQAASGEEASLGRLYVVPRSTCESCGGRVFEIASCRNCGTPYLLAYRNGPLSAMKFLWGEVEGHLEPVQLLPKPPRWEKVARELRVHVKTGLIDTELAFPDAEVQSVWVSVDGDHELQDAFERCASCQPPGSTSSRWARSRVSSLKRTHARSSASKRGSR